MNRQQRHNLLVENSGFGAYGDLQLIHQGRRHAVYRARHVFSNERAVLKLPRESSLAAIDLLRREYNLLKNIGAPGIVRLVTFLELGSRVALVTQDAGSKTLSDMIRDGRLRGDEFLSIASRLAESLGLIHKAGIIHRNLCPDNFVIDDDSGLPTIVDFDTAALAGDGELGSTRSIRPGKTGGSLCYCAPEQTGFINQPVDTRSDLYSLGVVFYELLTGHPPFEISDPLEMVHHRLSSPPVAPHERNSTVPVLVSKIVMRLLTKKPESRYQSASDLARDLAYVRQHLDHIEAKSFVPGLEQAIEKATQNGDTMFAQICSGHRLVSSLIAGIPLPELIEQGEKISYRLSTESVTSPLEMVHVIELPLRRLIESDLSPKPSDPDYLDTCAEHLLRENILLAGLYYVIQLQAYFVGGEYEKAVAAGKKAESLLLTHITFPGECEYWYYFPLVLAQYFDQVSESEKAEYLAIIEKHEKQLRTWSANGRAFFENKHLLVAAELSRLQNRDLEAQKLYEESIESARQNGFIQNEAIANERAWLYYRSRGLKTAASAYLKEAIACYERWGAKAVVEKLYAQEPELKPPTTTSWPLEITTVFKAAQAISSEVRLDNLLKTLMRVLIEAAGAQTGLLILKQNEDFVVRARSNSHLSSEKQYEVETRIEETPIDQFERLPRSLFNYVCRTHAMVVLDDAKCDVVFGKDHYFRERATRSVLCMPILKQSKLLGVLYLENDLASHVFSNDRRDLLQLLSAQVVTSLENVMLFEALKDSEQHYKKFFEIAVVGTGEVDCYSKRFLRANSKMCQITGYSERELLGMTPTDLTHPEDRVRDLEQFRELMEGDYTQHQIQKRYVRKDGKVIWVQVNNALIRDALGHPATSIAIIQDITAQRQSEEELRRSEELFRWLVLDVTDHSILMLDDQGRVLTWNTGAQRISGYNQEEITGQHLSKFFARDDDMDPLAAKLLELAVLEGRYEGIHSCRRMNGSVFPASIVITALRDTSGVLKGFALLTRDISEQMKLAEERKQLAVLQEREDFMAAITHDLKNPLIGANRILELFTNGSLGTLSSQQAQILRQLQQSNKDLTEMLRNLVEVYRLQQDPHSLKITCFSMDRLTSGCLKEIKPLLKSRGVKVTFDAVDSAIVEADMNYIRRVMQNLLDNALKFTPTNGRIIIKVERCDDYIVASISDSGPGLSKEEQQRMFQKFWQGAAGKRYVPGSGLGLHLCKEIVEAHGGAIQCLSEQDKGTTIRVSLPIISPVLATEDSRAAN
jgi:PAS domain S-box-containing protein